MLTITDRLHTYIVLSLLTERVLRSSGHWSGSRSIWSGSATCRRTSRSGGRSAGAGIPRQRSLGGPSRRPSGALRRCGSIGPYRRPNAWPLVSGGRRQGSCSPPRLERRWTRPTSGETSEGHCAWSPGSTRKSGHPASCGTRSSQCRPMLCAGRRHLSAGGPQRYEGNRVDLSASAATGDPDRREAGDPDRREGNGPAVQRGP